MVRNKEGVIHVDYDFENLPITVMILFQLAVGKGMAIVMISC